MGHSSCGIVACSSRKTPVAMPKRTLKPSAGATDNPKDVCATTKPLSRACPICECPVGTVLDTQRFVLSEGHPLQSSYDVVACGRCGFCFADTAVTQPGYDAYYARMSKYADSASTGAGVLP